MKFILIIVIPFIFTTNVFSQSNLDVKKTEVSSIEIFINNYGIIGFNNERNRSGFIYPYGSTKTYIFGSGIWFATKKRVNNELRKLVSLTYNPNNASSWMYPGNIGDSIPIPLSELSNKYFVEQSTDFTKNGKHQQNQMPNWSLWKTNEADEEGTYISSIIDRNLTKFPNGIAIKSDEMFHTRYRDDILNRYEGGVDLREAQGYPLGLQFDEKIYTWSQVPNNSLVIVQQSITNTSLDTLFDCYIGNVFDPDIGLVNSLISSLNDNISNITVKDNNGVEKKGIYAWTGIDKGELGKGFNYLVISQLETPAVNNDSLRSIKYSNKAAPFSEQIGTKSIKMYTSDKKLNTDTERYDFISSLSNDKDITNDDIKTILNTGPFTLLPGQTARVAYGISMVAPKNDVDATGRSEDLSVISDAIIALHEVYQNNLVTSIIENKIENSNISLNPNPIIDEFSLEYESKTDGEVKISLIDLTGVNIADLYTGFANTGNNIYNFSLAKYGLISGLYTLQIQSIGSIITQKVIIVR